MTLLGFSSERSSAVGLAGILMLGLSAAGCGGAEQQSDPVKPAPATSAAAAEARCDEGAAPPSAQDGAEFVDSAPLLAWHDAAFKAAFATAKNGLIGLENVRGWTMMHLAVHDALNGIRPVYAQYAFTGCQPDAHPTAAVAQAAHDVLVEVYPTLRESFDAELDRTLSAIPDGKGKKGGIALGKAAAAAVVAARENDGMLADAKYEPKAPKPGQYQLVPPLAFVYRPTFGDSRPFALKAGDQIKAPPPPALDSPEYAKAYNEVKAFGAKKSKARSADQTSYAAWWFEFAEVGWNRAAGIIARERKLDLYPAARMFALLNMGLSDATVTIWNAKSHYDTWRPVTAIHAAAKDGNHATAPDRRWESLMVCPPIQEYPSAHAIQSSTSAEILAAVLGSDDVAFSMESVTAPPNSKVRSFTKLSDAARQAADSRVMAGIHFRFATDVGLAMGKEVAAAIVSTQLTPRRSP